eukprot:7682947-Pyramimonas_sp.AAC.1
MAELRTRMSIMESSGGSGSGNRGTLSKQHIALINRMDVANCQLALIGFQTDSLSDRVRDIQSIVRQVGVVQPFHVGHFYKGPRNARANSASYVQFASEHDARSFLSAAGGKGKTFSVSTGNLVLKPAKTKANVMRDGASKAAQNKLKAAVPGRGVKIDCDERIVSVGGIP